MQVTTIGSDLAKSVFQVHGVAAEGKVVVTRRLRRGQVIDFFRKLPQCLVGMEACATAHHWARELMKLGHIVRLMPASYVKAYVKRSKNDAVASRRVQLHALLRDVANRRQRYHRAVAPACSLCHDRPVAAYCRKQCPVSPGDGRSSS